MAASTMFHQGNLQSGIALAIQQQKLVACFIYSPDDETSQTWENEYLTANTCSGNVCGQVGSLISEKAVLLKIEYGSTEAGFLNAFCPVKSAPCLVVIRNGQVLETIEGRVEREQFVERLGKAVGLDHEGEKEDEDITEPNTAVEREVMESDPLMSPATQQAPSLPTAQSPLTTQPTPSQQPNDSTQAHTLLAERARRLENERLRREATEKAARLARQKARQEEEAAAARKTTTTERNEQQRARDAWLYQQKQRKEEAKKEKARILQQIESDKQERKAAALRRKEGAAPGAGEFSELLAQSGEKAVATGVRHGSCALQIRLFDGSSIKGKFAADTDLATAVRTWVTEASPEGGADVPYSFRQILAPLPSRTIEVGEEGQSLTDLGLTPSATLVLVPVAGAVDAYSSGSGGYVGWLAGTAWSFGSSLLGAVPFLGGSAPSGAGAAADNGPYMAGTGDPQDLSNARGADMADADGGQTGTKVRVKTLADQRAEQQRKAGEGAEFYNGNSSAFQGEGDGK